MSNISKELVAECRRAVKDLSDAIEDRIAHWRALPHAIREALEFTSQVESGSAVLADVASVSREIIITLRPYAGLNELPYHQTKSLVTDTLRLLDSTRDHFDHGTGVGFWDKTHRLAQDLEAELEKLNKSRQPLKVRRLMEETVEVLNGFYHLPSNLGEHLSSELDDILERCRPADLSSDLLGRLKVCRERIATGHRLRSSLWNKLHSTIQQHMESAAAGLDALYEQFEEVIGKLRLLPGGAGATFAEELSARVAESREGVLDLRRLQKIAETLRETLLALPPALNQRPTQKTTYLQTRHFRFVVVEDNEQWQRFVRRSIEMVQDRLDDSFIIETEFYDNVANALNALLGQDREVPAGAEWYAENGVQTIAIVDMGLPADGAEVEAIRRGKVAPDRENGHRLLAEIREYRTNIPAIILTTPPYLLIDQLRACGQGVEDYSYVLKGPDKQQQLTDTILQVLGRSQSHRIELHLSPHYAARVDGIPIKLNEMPFRTFYALCFLSLHNRRRFFTPRHILDQLAYVFRDEYDYKRPPATPVEQALVLARQRSGHWWNSKSQMDIVNVIRLWAARKAESGGNLVKAWEALKKDYVVWHNAMLLFDVYRKAHPLDKLWAGQADRPVDKLEVALISAGFEQVFGGLDYEEYDSYDLHNIEDHVYQIRAAIHQAFNAVHRFIEPRREILTRGLTNEEYGYKVIGEISLPAGLIEDEHFGEDDDEEIDADDDLRGGQPKLSPNSSEERCTVLVVENEQNYSKRIRTLLEAMQFSVRVATNVEDAEAEARGMHRPDILCLDMHIPYTRRDFDADPSSGDAGNGLKALESVRRILPDIRVVIPTTLYDRDDLREQAVRLDVPVKYFVPKGGTAEGAPWEGHLLNVVSQLRQEIRSGSVLPPLPQWLCPVVQVKDGTDFKRGRLNLTVNGREFRIAKSGKQGRLFSVLLLSAGEELSYQDIDEYVGGKPLTEEARTQLLKNVRNKIRTGWLALPDDYPERPELQILRAVEGGLILHSYLINPSC